jgi:hypothetical protein
LGRGSGPLPCVLTKGACSQEEVTYGEGTVSYRTYYCTRGASTSSNPSGHGSRSMNDVYRLE